jgi:hypothetical protein
VASDGSVWMAPKGTPAPAVGARLGVWWVPFDKDSAARIEDLATRAGGWREPARPQWHQSRGHAIDFTPPGRLEEAVAKYRPELMDPGHRNNDPARDATLADRFARLGDAMLTPGYGSAGVEEHLDPVLFTVPKGHQPMEPSESARLARWSAEVQGLWDRTYRLLGKLAEDLARASDQAGQADHQLGIGLAACVVDVHKARLNLERLRPVADTAGALDRLTSTVARLVDRVDELGKRTGSGAATDVSDRDTAVRDAASSLVRTYTETGGDVSAMTAAVAELNTVLKAER